MKTGYLICLFFGLSASVHADQMVRPAVIQGQTKPLPPPLVRTDDCTISVNNHAVDYGRIVQSSKPMALAPQTVQITVSCLKTSKLALSVLAQTTGQNYSLGANGQLSMTLHDAVVDGQPVELAQIGGSTKSGEGKQMILTPSMGKVLPVRNHRPVAGRQWSLQLTTVGQLDTSSRPVSQATPFQNTVILALSQWTMPVLVGTSPQ